MLNNLTVKTRLLSLMAFFASILSIVGFIGITGINDSNESLKSVYFDRAMPLAQLSKIQDLMSDRVIQFILTSKQTPKNTIDFSELDRQTQSDINLIDKLWSDYMSTYLTPEEQVIAQDYSTLRNSFIHEGLLPALNLLVQGQTAQATAFMGQSVAPKYRQALEKSNALIDLQTRVAKEYYDEAKIRFNQQIILTVLFGLLANGLGLLAGYLIVRKLAKQLNEELSIAKKIAAGDFSTDLQVDPLDNTSLLYHLQKLQLTINGLADSQHLISQLHADGNSSETLWADAFPGIFRDIATHINDLLASHTALKMQIVEVVNHYAQGDFSVDMVRLPGENIKITEALDKLKLSLLSISGEIKTLCDAGIAGDFSKRSDTLEYGLSYQDLLEHLNQLMETCDTSFKVLASVMQDATSQHNGAANGNPAATAEPLLAQNPTVAVSQGQFRVNNPVAPNKPEPQRKAYSLEINQSAIGNPRIKAIDGTDWEEF